MSTIVILESGSYAHLNPLHSGFAHGFGVFETIRLTDGRLEFWKSHYQRLLRSARAFNLHFDQNEPAVLAAIRKLVESEKLRNGIVKLSLLHEGVDTCCYIYSRSPELPDETVNLNMDVQFALNERSALAGHKTHNYMEALYLKQLARRAGFFDSVRVNTHGFVTETTVANLFFIKNNRLHTPALSTGILPGVIRAEVLEAAQRSSIPVEEGCYPVESLKVATTVFLTNSSVGILPASSLVTDDFTVAYTVSNSIVDTLKNALDDSRKCKSTLLTDESIA